MEKHGVKPTKTEYFNPRAPCGARRCIPSPLSTAGTFQSTCPLRGTTAFSASGSCADLFQSTCPLRGTTLGKELDVAVRTISIHVPLAGHDLTDSLYICESCISIHVPLAGHDTPLRCDINFRGSFQSTCPLRGTTRPQTRGRCAETFQSTCPLRGTTIPVAKSTSARNRFQSTCPLRGTTQLVLDVAEAIDDFNPRAPCGARLNANRYMRDSLHFNPRAPCGARRQKGTKITVHFCENRLDLRFSANSAACQEQNRS